MPGNWAGSNRRSRLPANWDALRAEAHRLNPQHICHVCGRPGGDQLDHIIRGDDHRQSNLDWIHQNTPPYTCHRRKSSAEGNAAKKRVSINRPPERHPGSGRTP
jgi:5-methylcytosine-specific restriction protein A